MHLFNFVIALILILIIDYIWLAKLMNRFYLAELGGLVRTNQRGRFEPVIWAALIVYLALALGITALVLPLAQASIWASFGYGAILGFSIYAVYDFTNLSLVKNWPLKMSLVDVAWGTFLCATVSALTTFTRGLISV